MNDESIKLLLSRRSVSAKNMTGPGPTHEQLEMILRAGSRVPDHGKLAPWRFIIFEGDARARFGDVLAKAYKVQTPDAKDSQIKFERGRFMRAPVVVAVISSVQTDVPIPKWEQRLSAGAVCQNILIAATALGLAANWLTEWCAYDEKVGKALELGENERVAGFVYLGNAKEKPEERKRPQLEDIVTRWKD